MSYADPEAYYVVERVTIRMFYVPHSKSDTVTTWPIVTPRSPLWLRRIAEQVGRQYRRETHFIAPPYEATEPDSQHVILLESRHLIGQAVLIAGAIGITNADTKPYLAWVWVHPYERGHGLVIKMWPDASRRYPSIRGVHEDRDPHNTPAGNALLDRLSNLEPR